MNKSVSRHAKLDFDNYISNYTKTVVTEKECSVEIDIDDEQVADKVKQIEEMMRDNIYRLIERDFSLMNLADKADTLNVQTQNLNIACKVIKNNKTKQMVYVKMALAVFLIILISILTFYIVYVSI